MKRTAQRTTVVDETAHKLRGYVQKHFKPGDCLPTIRELAVKMQVSTATLRAAQSLLCKEGFLEPRHGSGVYVNDRAAHRLVAVVSELNILHHRVSGFYRDLVSELRHFFQAHQVRTRLYVGEIEPGMQVQETTCPEFVTDVAARRFDGIVPVAMEPHPSWMKWVQRYDVPVVGLGQGFAYHVRYATDAVFSVGLRILREQGCQRVAVLWWGAPEHQHVRQMVAAAGLETRDNWLRNDLHPSSQGAGWDEFREIWSARAEKPDGLLVTDDVLFEGAVDGILASGIRVPEQMRIVLQSHLNSRRRYPFPVTVLADDPAAMARVAGTMLLQLMNGAPVTERVVTLEHQIVLMPAWGRDWNPPASSSVSTIKHAEAHV